MAECTVNHKCYIGKTVETLEKRRYRHHYDAFERKSMTMFACALRKYGLDSFDWIVLEEHDADGDLLVAEVRLIDVHGTHRHGYNMTPGGEGAAGLKHRPETVTKRKASLHAYWADPAAHVEHSLRVPRGERCHLACVTEQDVIAIREEWSSVRHELHGSVEAHATDIARRYPIDVDGIRAIVRGRTWKHVGGLIDVGGWIRPLDVIMIRLEWALNEHVRGMKQRHGDMLASRYHVGPRAIGNIVSGKTWSSVPMHGSLEFDDIVLAHEFRVIAVDGFMTVAAKAR